MHNRERCRRLDTDKDKENIERVWQKILELLPPEGSDRLRVRDLADMMQSDGQRPIVTSACVASLQKMKMIKVGWEEYAPNKMAGGFIRVVEKKRDADLWGNGYRGKPSVSSWLMSIVGRKGPVALDRKKQKND